MERTEEGSEARELLGHVAGRDGMALEVDPRQILLIPQESRLARVEIAEAHSKLAFETRVHVIVRARARGRPLPGRDRELDASRSAPAHRADARRWTSRGSRRTSRTAAIRWPRPVGRPDTRAARALRSDAVVSRRNRVPQAALDPKLPARPIRWPCCWRAAPCAPRRAGILRGGRFRARGDHSDKTFRLGSGNISGHRVSSGHSGESRVGLDGIGLWTARGLTQASALCREVVWERRLPSSSIWMGF